MKYLLCGIFILNIGVSIALAQSPPSPPSSPPPPLIYKAPQKSELRTFYAGDKTFQITFPGMPLVSKKEAQNGLVTNYRVYRQGSNSIVNTNDFRVDLEQNKGKLFEIIKAHLLKVPKSRIEAEKDILIDGTSGKEFDVLFDYQYQKIRILIVGKRVYEIKSDITNWHIIGDNTKKEFFAETDRFFNSFKFLAEK